MAQLSNYDDDKGTFDLNESAGVSLITGTSRLLLNMLCLHFRLFAGKVQLFLQNFVDVHAEEDDGHPKYMLTLVSP